LKAQSMCNPSLFLTQSIKNSTESHLFTTAVFHSTRTTQLHVLFISHL